MIAQHQHNWLLTAMHAGDALNSLPRPVGGLDGRQQNPQLPQMVSNFELGKMLGAAFMRDVYGVVDLSNVFLVIN